MWSFLFLQSHIWFSRPRSSINLRLFILIILGIKSRLPLLTRIMRNFYRLLYRILYRILIRLLNWLLHRRRLLYTLLYILRVRFTLMLNFFLNLILIRLFKMNRAFNILRMIVKVHRIRVWNWSFLPDFLLRRNRGNRFWDLADSLDQLGDKVCG